MTAEHHQALDAASRVELGFPHDFLANPFIREVAFGQTFDLIDRK